MTPSRASVTERASTSQPVTKLARPPRLLDLFCKEGGAAAGYWLAGWDVVGVDKEPQPRYPFEFRQADALEFLAACGWRGFDAIHASPPCQAFTSMRALAVASGSRKEHPDLIAPARALLRATGLPYVIENVPGAPLKEPVQLCGSSFGLDIQRHRLFELSIALLVPPCAHGWQTPRFEVRIGQPNSRSNGKDRKNPLSRVVTVVGNSVIAEDARRAMGMPWATRDGCSQAVPPAYTQLLGTQLLEHVAPGAAAFVTGRDVEDLALASRNTPGPREVLIVPGCCEICLEPIARALTGRRRRFCGDACRQRAHRRAIAA